MSEEKEIKEIKEIKKLSRKEKEKIILDIINSDEKLYHKYLLEKYYSFRTDNIKSIITELGSNYLDEILLTLIEKEVIKTLKLSSPIEDINKVGKINILKSISGKKYEEIKDLINFLMKSKIETIKDLINLSFSDWKDLMDKYEFDDSTFAILRGVLYPIFIIKIPASKLDAIDKFFYKCDKGTYTEKCDILWRNLIRSKSRQELQEIYNEIYYGFPIPEAPPAPIPEFMKTYSPYPYRRMKNSKKKFKRKSKRSKSHKKSYKKKYCKSSRKRKSNKRSKKRSKRSRNKRINTLLN